VYVCYVQLFLCTNVTLHYLHYQQEQRSKLESEVVQLRHQLTVPQTPSAVKFEAITRQVNLIIKRLALYSYTLSGTLM
jgi:hypothetical protein